LNTTPSSGTTSNTGGGGGLRGSRDLEADPLLAHVDDLGRNALDDDGDAGALALRAADGPLSMIAIEIVHITWRDHGPRR
jgi:hypothetical protein